MHDHDSKTLALVKAELDRDERLRRTAAARFALPSVRVKRYHELTEQQVAEADRYWGIKPQRNLYLYAVKADGGLVWDRLRIAELQS